MAKAQKVIQTSVTFNLNESVVEAILAASGAASLQDVAQPLIEKTLTSYSKGGFLLNPADIERISKSAGKTIDSSEKVVDAVEAAVGKKGYEHQFNVGIDPVMIGVLQDIAHTRGVTLEEVVQDCWDTATALGWFYEVPGNCMQFILSEFQKAELCKILNKVNLTGTDIFDHVKQVSK